MFGWVSHDAGNIGGEYVALGRSGVLDENVVLELAWCSFFFSSRRRHTRLQGDWSSDVCSSDLTRWVPRRRADIMVAGVAAIARLMRRLGTQRVLVNDRGIRDGVLLSMIDDLFGTTPPTRAAVADRMEVVRRFARKCHSNERHCEHAATLAAATFDAPPDAYALPARRSRTAWRWCGGSRANVTRTSGTASTWPRWPRRCSTRCATPTPSPPGVATSSGPPRCCTTSAT